MNSSIRNVSSWSKVCKHFYPVFTNGLHQQLCTILVTVTFNVFSLKETLVNSVGVIAWSLSKSDVVKEGQIGEAMTYNLIHFKSQLM